MFYFKEILHYDVFNMGEVSLINRLCFLSYLMIFRVFKIKSFENEGYDVLKCTRII